MKHVVKIIAVIHSNWGNLRWSDVSTNIAYQQHNLFIYQGGLSSWCDLSNFLALPDNSWQPSPISKNAFTGNFPYVTRFVIINARTRAIKFYKNQLVIMVEPTRTGLQVIDFNHKKLQQKQLLVQMSTTTGSELDYLIAGFPPL